MLLYVFCFIWGSVYCHNVTIFYTLEGNCPDIKLYDSLNYTRFSGNWYSAASFASDNRTINECVTLEFQEDNLGYTLRETYVDPDLEQGSGTNKTSYARVDPTFDAGNKAKFVVSYESGDNVLQYPFIILTTDYDHYAVTYTCKNMGRKARKHYVFIWILTRSKEKLEGEQLKKVEAAISKFPALVEHRPSFVFSEASCALI